MTVLVGGSTLVANCHENDNNKNNKQDLEEDEIEEDPYDSLPDEDEPTHCSICLTYRQGPCRPYWRKVERCTKDHEFKKEEQDLEAAKEGGDETSGKLEKEQKDNDDDEEELQEPPCLKYMIPWIDCATTYRNLYSLIELDTNYAAGIADLEKEATMKVCWSPSAAPTVDWTPWQDYVAEHPEWKLPKRSTASKKKDDHRRAAAAATSVSLWKTLDTDEDPELVDILALVPTKQGEGIIECAYALDQDGNVLGFSYGTKPSEAAKTIDEEDDVDGEGPLDLLELKIRLLPLRTRRITIAAAYTQPVSKAPTQPTEPESHIFQSRPFSLKKMGNKQ
jgi:hypothetical protein